MKYLLAILFMAHPAIANDLVGKAEVTDGDSLKINGERIRVHGIDAPEKRQRCERDGLDWMCGEDASAALKEYIGGLDLRCERLDTDRYGRIVARCTNPDGIDIGEWMVSNGWALAYRQYSKDYVDEETEAEVANRGIWASEFQKPWEWRRSR